MARPRAPSSPHPLRGHIRHPPERTAVRTLDSKGLMVGIHSFLIRLSDVAFSFVVTCIASARVRNAITQNEAGSIRAAGGEAYGTLGCLHAFHATYLVELCHKSASLVTRISQCWGGVISSGSAPQILSYAQSKRYKTLGSEA